MCVAAVAETFRFCSHVSFMLRALGKHFLSATFSTIDFYFIFYFFILVVFIFVCACDCMYIAFSSPSPFLILSRTHSIRFISCKMCFGCAITSQLKCIYAMKIYGKLFEHSKEGCTARSAWFFSLLHFYIFLCFPRTLVGAIC